MSLSPVSRSIAFVLGAVPVTVSLRLTLTDRAKVSSEDLAEIPAGSALALSLVGNMDRGGGQITDSLRKLNEAQDNPSDAVESLCDLWDRWHMNDARAGTDRQEAVLAGYRADCKRAGKSYDFADACAYLERAGLLTDRGYKYGTAWLMEPIPADVVAELGALLDKLNGDTVGDLVEVDDAPDISGDIVDPSDVSKRLEIYRAAARAYGVDPATIRHDGPDWPEGDNAERDEILSEWIKLRTAFDTINLRDVSGFIADDHFEAYAEEFAKDIGALKDEDQWPYTHIDWEAAAEALKADYSSVEYDGTTYWFNG